MQPSPRAPARQGPVTPAQMAVRRASRRPTLPDIQNLQCPHPDGSHASLARTLLNRRTPKLPDEMSAPGHMAAPELPASPPRAPGLRLGRLLPFALILLVGGAVTGAAWYTGLTPIALLERRVAIDAFVGEHRLAALATFAAIYALSVALSLPGGAVLTICGGIVFGGLAGGTAALIGATVGATAIFLIAKSALGGWLVRRAGGRAEKAAAGFCADAFSYLLFLRLVPVFPFWLVNLVPALCGVRLATYVAATALGIIPGTFAFAFFGAGLDRAVTAPMVAYRACVAAGGTHCRHGFDPSTAVTPQLIAGLVVLGVLSLVPVLLKRWRAARATSDVPSRP